MSLSLPLTNLEDLREQHLVEPARLQERLTDPKVIVVDMRGYVRVQTEPSGSQTADYQGAREEYLKEHIPGAVYLDWTEDIVDLDDPVPVQIAGAEKIARVLGGAGIGDDTLVVAYDNHPAAQFATRLWWVLRYFGHDEVRVLNGGLARWQSEGRPLSAELPSTTPRVFTPRIRPALRINAEGVAALIGSPGIALVDARDEAQYTGATRRGPRGGHIPGAIHLPREALFAPDGSFRTPEEIQQIVDGAGIDPDHQFVAYCNGGVAATSVLFALSMLGHENWSNYDGSWNEWGKRADLPIAAGASPG